MQLRMIGLGRMGANMARRLLRASTRSSPRSRQVSPQYGRFASRGDGTVADRITAAMRQEFGGHVEKPFAGKEG